MDQPDENQPFDYEASSRGILRAYHGEELSLSLATKQLWANRDSGKLSSEVIEVVEWMDELVGLSDIREAQTLQDHERKLRRHLGSLLQL